MELYEEWEAETLIKKGQRPEIWQQKILDLLIFFVSFPNLKTVPIPKLFFKLGGVVLEWKLPVFSILTEHKLLQCFYIPQVTHQSSAEKFASKVASFFDFNWAQTSVCF